MHGLNQWMENSARLDVFFAVRVLGAAVGKNTPAHDEAMMRLVAWVYAHDTDGIVYGGDKAALGKGFVAWPDASFTDGFKALSTQGSIQVSGQRSGLVFKTAVMHSTGYHGGRVHFSLYNGSVSGGLAQHD